MKFTTGCPVTKSRVYHITAVLSKWDNVRMNLLKMVSRILKFTVYMALVVFEVGSLSKVMTNMNHMSFDSLDEAIAVGPSYYYFV